MALIHVNFLSEALMRTVPVQVILPVDKMGVPGSTVREEKPFKTLYLLHGIFGNYTDWVSGTNIQRWAEERSLAVVMPSGDNMFYVDQKEGHNFYGEYIGRELVEMTRRMFPLSRKREDTYIGGLSMGGYGALRNGLKYSGTFGCIASLSGAMLIDDIAERTDDTASFIDSRTYAQSVFGNLEQAAESDKNPKWLVRRLKEEGKDIPKIYLTCGRQDSLLGPNREFRDFLKEQGVDVTYVEGDGGHEWDFWNRSIREGLEWLPLETCEAGINSGNVGL